ncbi:MAG: hypothetical protein FWG50_04785 [Kiritimatiellaeota bacterium]|nr:hypothetical protein [Kiritimatiellota bacterium]
MMLGTGVSLCVFLLGFALLELPVIIAYVRGIRGHRLNVMLMVIPLVMVLGTFGSGKPSAVDQAPSMGTGSSNAFQAAAQIAASAIWVTALVSSFMYKPFIASQRK